MSATTGLIKAFPYCTEQPCSHKAPLDPFGPWFLWQQSNDLTFAAKTNEAVKT
jgi:hypothetical protein